MWRLSILWTDGISTDKSVRSYLRDGSIVVLRHLHVGSALASNKEIPFQGNNNNEKLVEPKEVFLDPSRNQYCAWRVEIAFSHPGNSYKNYVKNRVKHWDLIRLKHVASEKYLVSKEGLRSKQSKMQGVSFTVNKDCSRL